jgi:thioredoxin 1
MTLEINDQNFDQEIKQFVGVALVDFWAPWCAPCRMQGPILEELSKELADQPKIKIAKLNVDDNKIKSEEYSVMSIPNLKLFKDGQVVEDLVGVQNKNKLKELFNKYLS